jgi:undecaprenyl-diphosphatase
MQIGIHIVLLLAVIQGLTEFLPVSSSGHLVLVETLFGVRRESAGLIFEVAVHVGTLGAIMLVYRRRVVSICGALAGCIAGGFRIAEENRDEVTYTGRIIVASIPAACVGLFLHDEIADMFDSPAFTSLLLVFTGCFLLLSRLRRAGGGLTWTAAFLIGVAQAVAVLPGCSRSGWTITTALLLGLGFEKSAEFSFLLSIPAILGALLLEIVKNPGVVVAGSAFGLIIGAVTAFCAGWIALRLLLNVLVKGNFHTFSYYLIPVGLIALLYFMMAG